MRKGSKAEAIGTQGKLGLAFMNFNAVKIWPYKKSNIKEVF